MVSVSLPVDDPRRLGRRPPARHRAGAVLQRHRHHARPRHAGVRAGRPGGVTAGLILIAVGSGGLKANATSVVGSLYSREDPRRDAGFSLFYLGINLGAFIGPILTGLLQSTVGFHFGFGLAVVAYSAVILTNRQVTAVERKRVFAFLPLFVASAAFRSLYQQPSTTMKFAIGTAAMGAAFLLFLPFADGGANSTPLLAMIGILLAFTVAELLLSPVELSVATKLAPGPFQTQMVALFFLSIALGSAVPGLLAQWYATVPETVYFGVLGGIAILLALIARPILRLMGGVGEA